MIAAGASEEEVAQKRAKLIAKRSKRNNMQQQEYNQHQQNANPQVDGNMGYNQQRRNNGLYDRAANPFYRQGRNYNPRDMGGIRWNSYRPPGVPSNYNPTHNA